MIIAILILALIAILSIDLFVFGLQFVFFIIGAPFVFIYHFICQLLKPLFNKGKKANES